MLVAVLAATSALASTTAQANDRWETPTPGVRVLHRTTRYRDGRQVIFHAAYVDLCTPGFTFRVSAPSTGRRATSSWAQNAHALVAVNGDFFDGAPIRPLGPSRGSGVWWPERRKYFLSGWLASTPGQPIGVFDMHISGGGWSTQLTETDVISFQEHIVVDGHAQLSPFVMHGGRAPRTGVGITSDHRTMIFVAVDGRTSSSIGATTAELADVLVSLGAWQAVRFDGGGSTTLFVQGRGVVNHISGGTERVVANHLGIVMDSATPRPSFCPAT